MGRRQRGDEIEIVNDYNPGRTDASDTRHEAGSDASMYDRHDAFAAPEPDEAEQAEETALATIGYSPDVQAMAREAAKAAAAAAIKRPTKEDVEEIATAILPALTAQQNALDVRRNEDRAAAVAQVKAEMREEIDRAFGSAMSSGRRSESLRNQIMADILASPTVPMPIDAAIATGAMDVFLRNYMAWRLRMIATYQQGKGGGG